MVVAVRVEVVELVLIDEDVVVVPAEGFRDPHCPIVARQVSNAVPLAMQSEVAWLHMNWIGYVSAAASGEIQVAPNHSHMGSSSSKTTD